LDDTFRFLAIVNNDAGHVDLDIARSNNNEMIIESLFGLILMIAGGGDKSVDPTSAIIKGINQANKVIEKKKADELNASMHEEVYQMTKDTIYKLGGLK
tara:strand:- start:284 stop:580 length:297 start_codon:yes stop_codon:yes gene_type:complete